MRPLHRLIFAWSDTQTLEIEWDGGTEGADDAIDFPLLTRCTSESELDAFGVAGAPPICWRDSEDTLFEPLQLRENTEYLIDIHLPLSVHEAHAAWAEDNAWPLVTVRNAYKTDPPKRWKTDNDGITITGRLNFRSYVGAAQLSIPDSEPITLEVACAKIGYFDDFRAILDAIAEEYSSLLLEIDSPTFGQFSASDVTEPQLMTFLFLLRHAMEDARLPAAVESIISSPRSALVQHERSVLLGQQREPLQADFVFRLPEGSLQPGGPLAVLFRGFTPATVPEVTKRETFDTPENRYVKAFLENLRDSAEELAAILRDRSKNAVAHQVDTWIERLSDWLQHPLWSNVRRMTHFPSNSQILQKSASYREVLATDFRMQLGLALPWNAGDSLESDVHGDLRPISQLYEYWCFLFLRSILRNFCTEEQSAGNLIRTTEQGLSVVLQRGAESRVIFRYTDAQSRTAQVSLFYNKKFARTKVGATAWTDSYSAILNPDFSIRIDVVADTQNDRVHWLHFDAKYRLDVELWHAEVEDGPELFEEGATSEEEQRVGATYKRADLFKMHTYRDALLGSRGSYILFPGSEETETIFIRYPGVEYSEQGKRIPGVGAFQANPTHKQQQALQIESFIIACIERLVAAGDYQEEVGIVPDE